MNTEIFSEKTLPLAAALLRQGEVVAFPTETVYGLGALAFDPSALHKIFQAKGRPLDNPLIAHIGSVGDVERLAVDIPPEFYLLAQVFFPGALTIVLKRHPLVPENISAGLESIAVRMPTHPLALALIKLAGQPLAAPSANLSGRPSSTSCDHVLADFRGKIAGVVDGGEAQLGIESAVLSLLEPDRPLLLRPGTLQREEMEKVLGKAIEIGGKGDKVVSPGMKYRHYAPQCPMKLFTREEEILSYLSISPSKKRLLLANHPFVGLDTLEISAKKLYAHLRWADERQYEEVLVLCDPFIAADPALMNRLTKAAGIG